VQVVLILVQHLTMNRNQFQQEAMLIK